MPNEENTNNNGGDNATQQNTQSQVPSFNFDYEKLANIVSGRQAANEESVLKGYFKQQGLSKEEMQSAIDSFKEQKKANTPDIGALQSQISEATNRANTAMIEKEAILMSSELGVDIKTMPYVLKMADLKEVTVDGKVDNEKLKASLNKVLEDIPQLKTSTDNSNQPGFRVGANIDNNGKTNTEDEIKKAFGLK